MRVAFAPALGGALLLGLIGCTGSGGGRIAIRGAVSYKGAPLAKGVITFIPADGTQGTSEGALIADGKYAMAADKGLLPGSYRVSISSVEPKGAVDANAAPGAPKGAREVLPTRYNKDSKLKIDVTAGGKQEYDFPLD